MREKPNHSSINVLGITQLSPRRSPWRVRYRQDGKLRTKHFSTESEAQRWIEANELKPVSEFTENERLLIGLCRARQKRGGIDMEQTIQEFLEFAEIPRTVTISQGREMYIEDMHRRQLRPSYIKDAAYTLEKFVKDREDWPIVSFTPKQILTFCRLNMAGSTSQDTARSRLRTFFTWAKDCGYTQIDTEQIKWRKARKDSKVIEFWEPDQVWRFVEACPRKLQFPMALLFLSGVRPLGEFMQLSYDHLDLENGTIYIPSNISKTRNHRIIRELGDLWKLYEPKEGKVCPVSYRNLRTHIQRTCQATGLKWSHDVSRHTFATCAFHRSLEWAMENMGHSSSKIFMRHYKGVINPEKAEKLWKIPERLCG